MPTESLDEVQLLAISERLRESVAGVLKGASHKLIFVESDGFHSIAKEALLAITPTSSTAAPVEIRIVPDFGAYVQIGKGSVFEVPFKAKRYTNYEFVEEITTLISGLVYGGFEEDVFVSRGVVVGASGEIESGGQLLRSASESWMKLGWNIFRKREREHHKYTPYCP